MNDAEYLFHQTEVTGKRIARGSRNQKRGGGRHCHLPSDYLTKAEKNKLNGEPLRMNLKKPIKWQALREFPVSVQTCYISGVIQEFDPTNAMLRDLLGVSEAALQYIQQTRSIAPRKGHHAKPDMEKWNRWLAGEEPTEEVPQTEEPSVPKESEESIRPEAPKLNPDIFASLPPLISDDFEAFLSKLQKYGVKEFSLKF